MKIKTYKIWIAEETVGGVVFRDIIKGVKGKSFAETLRDVFAHELKTPNVFYGKDY